MKRALVIDESSFGKDHPVVARDLNNLAQLYKEMERLLEAELLYLRAIKIFKDSLGENHPRTQTVITNYNELLKVMER